ncbi:pantetheine-phosphate adenylyltransferase [Oceanirhabdus sp. W0125-5]|uniref:pantetheine-phosphate adenylyltransferase n=1 Tax=Oceanirhabdus sp. W0125-5 TaxID=2999116 RepID=UPI0022F3401A|nr:pantetheine-phosphate adenylyltransferase [Oceanirhabdus sp. W0125-5]WBW94794.1 pantetheine-phosphate adenylyltransferase [Oceanirhabdus sp. W0125-5]
MRVAVFTGSFDPITLGHYDIIERGSKIFDKVIVLVMVNPDKKGLFELEERVELIKKTVSDLYNVEVDAYWGLLVDYMKERNYNIIIKGLRNTNDFNYEYDMESANKKLYSDVETVFLMSDRNKSFISSSMVKQIAKFGGELNGCVSKEVECAILDKMRL